VICSRYFNGLPQLSRGFQIVHPQIRGPNSIALLGGVGSVLDMFYRPADRGHEDSFAEIFVDKYDKSP